MIAYGIQWPSIAEDSELLARRIAVAQRVAFIRRHAWSPIDWLDLAA